MRRGLDRREFAYAAATLLCGLLATLIGLARHAENDLGSHFRLLSPGFVESDFYVYNARAFNTFLPQLVADRVPVKQNIRKTDTSFAIEPGTIATQPFRPPRYMAIPILGSSADSVRTLTIPDIYLRCTFDDRRLKLLNGPSEGWMLAYVHLPANWCPGDVEVVGTAREAGVGVGVGVPFEISRLYWLLSGSLGTIAAVILALALVSLVTGPILALGRYAIWARLVAAAAYPTVAGYLSFMLFWFIPGGVARMLIASVLALGPLAMLLVERARGRSALDLDTMRVFLAGLLCVATICGAPYALAPVNNGFWYPAFAFFPASWSTDNLLSVMMARSIVMLGPGHPDYLGTWSISDRGVVQAGTFNLAFTLPIVGAAFLTGPFNAVASNIYGCLLQGLPLPCLIVYLRSLGWTRDRITMAGCVAAASPFFVFNAFYIWPKLYGGMFVAVSILALWRALRTCGVVALCTAVAAYFAASLSHSSNLLAAPALLLYLGLALLTRQHSAREIISLARRGLLQAIATGVVAAFILKSPELIEPKSSWPILYLATGQGQFGLTPDQVNARLLEYLHALRPIPLLQQRLERLESLGWISDTFFTRSQPWLSLSYVRAVEEFSLLPSLGPGAVVLLLHALLKRGRWFSSASARTSGAVPLHGPEARQLLPGQVRSAAATIDADDLTATMGLLWVCCVLNLVILALVQAAMPVVHQLPYGLVEGVILGLIAVHARHRGILAFAAVLQGFNALLFWYGGTWIFWHTRL